MTEKILDSKEAQDKIVANEANIQKVMIPGFNRKQKRKLQQHMRIPKEFIRTITNKENEKKRQEMMNNVVSMDWDKVKEKKAKKIKKEEKNKEIEAQNVI